MINWEKHKVFGRKVGFAYHLDLLLLNSREELLCIEINEKNSFGSIDSVI